MDNRAELIKRLRVERKWLQADVADRIPGKVLSIQRISDRERGRTPVDPSEDALFAAAFGLSVNEFRAMVRPDKPIGPGGIPIKNAAPAGGVIDYERYGLGEAAACATLEPDSDTKNPDLFAIRVVGGSLAPDVQRSDTLVLSSVAAGTADPAIIGRIVLACTAGGGCALGRWEPVDGKRVKIAGKTYPRASIASLAVGVQVRRKLN